MDNMQEELAVVTLTQAETGLTEGCYRISLRSIQLFHLRTATETIHLLLGTLPAEGNIHNRVLGKVSTICKAECRCSTVIHVLPKSLKKIPPAGLCMQERVPIGICKRECPYV